MQVFHNGDVELCSIRAFTVGKRFILEASSIEDAVFGSTSQSYQFSLTREQLKTLHKQIGDQLDPVELADMEKLMLSHPSDSKLIIHAAAQTCGLEYSDIVGPKRTRHILIPRQAAICVIRQRTNLSLPEIGKLFHRDHSTIISSLNRVERLCSPEDGLFNHEASKIVDHLNKTFDNILRKRNPPDSPKISLVKEPA